MATEKAAPDELIPVEIIERRLIRGRKVMLDADLAALYQVPTGALNQAMRRNRDRFPEGFMFQLTSEELAAKMALRKPPLAFTEQGVAMSASVLRSKRAIAVNVAIMRTFVRLRQILATHKELSERLDAMEKKYDQRFKAAFDVLKHLTEPPPAPPKRPIGFTLPGTRRK